MENKIIKLLCEWGVCDSKMIEPYYPRLRDRDDISMMRCRKSGAIFTSSSEHINISDYAEKEDLDHWRANDRKEAALNALEDDTRRKNQIQNLICNKKWLDIGTGVGGILDLLEPFTKRTVCVEPQKQARDLIKEKYEAYSDVSEVPYDDFDVVTFFHVFEHLNNPLDMLKVVFDKMNKGGKVIIEVPHANDFLLSFLDLDCFKQFTFWSEHLILHTRPTIKVFLEKANFKNIVIKGFQRYSLANHFYWLKNGEPCGHIKWGMLRTKELDQAYSNLLKSIDMTDTLIVFAEKV